MDRPSSATRPSQILRPELLGLEAARIHYARESFAEAERLLVLARRARAGELEPPKALAESIEAQARHLKRTSALICFHAALVPVGGWMPVLLAGVLGGLVVAVVGWWLAS
jgi:hypothetical protein